jgi:hypothetical protein
MVANFTSHRSKREALAINSKQVNGTVRHYPYRGSDGDQDGL